MVEAVEKSEEKKMVDDVKNRVVRSDGGDEEQLEEGAIAGGNDDPLSSSSSRPGMAITHSWTFWFDNPSAMSKQAEWGCLIQHAYTFSNVEEFWSLYNNIDKPSKLAARADFHCFKNKIEPKWEDPVCANGGKWTMAFSKPKSDQCWLYTLLAMIGKQFDHGDDICGAVVYVRTRLERIALWTKNAANETAQVR